MSCVVSDIREDHAAALRTARIGAGPLHLRAAPLRLRATPLYFGVDRNTLVGPTVPLYDAGVRAARLRPVDWCA